MIFADKEYRRYFDAKWGLDLLGGCGTKKVYDVVDPFLFFNKESAFNVNHMIKIVEWIRKQSQNILKSDLVFKQTWKILKNEL